MARPNPPEPGIVLGLTPAIVAICTGNGWLMWFAVFFTAGAAGDILSLLKLRFLLIALPLAAIILVLARFIGSEFIDLPPVLDSYWRPIHVGIASISYGVALVCFAVAVLYLLKDGLKVEKMAVWTSIFALAVFATISKFSVFNPSKTL